MEKDKLISLVNSAKQGDSTAMETLFSEFYNDVYYFALKTVMDSETACDITQETFLEIIRTIDKLQEPVAFVTWMKKITYHQCTGYFKKKKDILVEEDEYGNTVFDTLEDENSGSIPQEVYEKDEFRQTIMSMVDSLSEEQRSAVMLYYFDELSVGKIAEIQGVSEGTVKSRLNYARKGIKKSVEAYEEKHGVKLHSVAFLPLFLLGFGEKTTMPLAKVELMSNALSKSASSSGSAAKSVAASSKAVSKSAGIAAKVASLPIVTKVIAAVVAVALLGGGIALGVRLAKNNNELRGVSVGAVASTNDEISNTSISGGASDENVSLNLNINTNYKTVSVDWGEVAAVRNDGTVLFFTGVPQRWEMDKIASWTNVLEVEVNTYYVVALKDDGTVEVARDTENIRGDISKLVDGWTDIVSVSTSGFDIYGLKSDGTLLHAVSAGGEHECSLNNTGAVALKGDYFIKGDKTLNRINFDSVTGEHIFETSINGLDDVVAFSDEAVVRSDGTVTILDSWNKDDGILAPGLAVDPSYQEVDLRKEISEWHGITDVSLNDHIVGLKADGTVVAAGRNDFGECDVFDWTDIVDIFAVEYNGHFGTTYNDCTIGLKSDGTLVYASNSTLGPDGKICTSYEPLLQWNDIRLPSTNPNIYVSNVQQTPEIKTTTSASENLVPNGSVSDTTQSVESNTSDAETNLSTTPENSVRTNSQQVQINGELFWEARTPVNSLMAAGANHVVAIKNDGTVVAAGDNNYGQCNVASWSDIKTVSAGDEHTVGLKADGTVVATGNNNKGQCNVSGWSDIISVSAASCYTLGLKSDGTILVAYDLPDSYDTEYHFLNDVLDWQDVYSISAGRQLVVALQDGGTVLKTGRQHGTSSERKGLKESIFACEDESLAIMQQGSVACIELYGYFTGDPVPENFDNQIIVYAYHNGNAYFGLTDTGKVIVDDYSASGLYNTSDWSDIVYFATGDDFIVGLKDDGTVVCTGNSAYIGNEVTLWSNIKIPGYEDCRFFTVIK